MIRNTMPSVHQVADFFLSRNDPTAGDVISNLKLQKLCYFAQAISLCQNDTAIFAEEIQAWAHGPVMPELYKRFKKYGWQAIDPTDLGTYDEKLNGKNLPLLEAVWAVFSPLSAKQLEKLTHEHEPWRAAYGDTPLGGRCTAEISIASMKAFYRQEKQKNWWKALVEQSDRRHASSSF